VVPEGTSDLASLVRAHRARAIAVGWLAAAVVFAIVATLGGGLALLLWSAARTAALVVGGVVAVSMIVAVTGWARGAQHNAVASKALEAAHSTPLAPLLASEEEGT
jgi:hypothetical protein